MYNLCYFVHKCHWWLWKYVHTPNFHLSMVSTSLNILHKCFFLLISITYRTLTYFCYYVYQRFEMLQYWEKHKLRAEAHFASQNILLFWNPLHCYLLLKRTVCFKLACYSLHLNTLYPSAHFAYWNIFLHGTFYSPTPFAS